MPGCTISRLERWSERRNLRQFRRCAGRSDPGLKVILGAMLGPELKSIRSAAAVDRVVVLPSGGVVMRARAIVCMRRPGDNVMLAARMEQPRLASAAQTAYSVAPMPGHSRAGLPTWFSPRSAPDAFVFIDDSGRYAGAPHPRSPPRPPSAAGSSTWRRGPTAGPLSPTQETRSCRCSFLSLATPGSASCSDPKRSAMATWSAGSPRYGNTSAASSAGCPKRRAKQSAHFTASLCRRATSAGLLHHPAGAPRCSLSAEQALRTSPARSAWPRRATRLACRGSRSALALQRNSMSRRSSPGPSVLGRNLRRWSWPSRYHLPDEERAARSGTR